MSDLNIKRGSTFRKTLRWLTDHMVYKPITGMPSTAPVRFTVPAHGMTDGAIAAISGLVGPSSLNAANSPPLYSDDPLYSDFRVVTVVDVDTIEFNDINAAAMPAYVSGGVVQFREPVDLTGMTARLHIRTTMDAPDPPELELTTENGGIEVYPSAHRIDIVIADEQTEVLLVATGAGVWDIEMLAGDEVERIDEGAVTCSPEVTRTEAP